MTEQTSQKPPEKGTIFPISCRGASGKSKPIPAFVEVVQCSTGTWEKPSKSYVLCPRLTGIQLDSRYGVVCYEGKPLPNGYDYDTLYETTLKMKSCQYFMPSVDTLCGRVTYSAMLPWREPQEPKQEKPVQPQKPAQPRLYKTPIVDRIVSALFPDYYSLRLRDMQAHLKSNP